MVSISTSMGFGWRALAVALLLLCAACDRSGPPQSQPSKHEPPPDAATIERGKYLAAIGNCISCHTRAGGTEYAGGVKFETPFGVIYSSNITPDSSTGIGSWTKQDLRRAMHEGVAPGGKRLFPAFPYTSFTKVSDEDTDAIFAFLRTLAPIRYAPPNNGLVLRVRWPLTVWNSQFLRDGRFREDPAQSAEWNRGAYLVEGLGHCSACHTPRNLWMAERQERKYSGGSIRHAVAAGQVRAWSAVNLTSSKQGLGSWSVNDLAQYLRTGFSLRAGTFGPMNEVIVNSLKHLTPQDARAMATYIKALPPQDIAGEGVAAAAVAEGAAIYQKRCEKCHGESGRGGMFSGPPLAGSAIAQSEDPSALINLLVYGPGKAPGVSFGKWETMLAYGDTLDDTQIAAVSNYIRGSWGNRAPAVGPDQVGKQR